MIIAVQGTPEFNDYNVLLRAMGVAISGLSEDDKEIVIWSVGPANINSYVSEFSNMSERSMKSRGMKIKFYKVPKSYVEENINSVDYFAFLSKPKQPYSGLTKYAEAANIEVGIFQY